MTIDTESGPKQANARETLLLTRAMIARTMKFGDYVTAVEDGFRRFEAANVLCPQVVHIPAAGGAFHIKSAAFVDDPRYVAVKVNGNFPDNRSRNGLPTIQGAITLCDGRDGSLLAIIDSIEVTAQRTAAATAVAAKYLADPHTTSATIVGCGVQGRIQLEALLHALPLKTVYAFDSDSALCESFASEMSVRFGLKVESLRELSEGTLRSRAIVTCTSSRTAYLDRRHVAPGTFIAAVGADSDDKQELHPDLLASSTIVVDILEQCAQIGELHHALEAGVVALSDVFASLGEIVSAGKQCNTGTGRTIVFDSTGSAIQDVAAAGVIFERALEQGLGLPVSMA